MLWGKEEPNSSERPTGVDPKDQFTWSTGEQRMKSWLAAHLWDLDQTEHENTESTRANSPVMELIGIRNQAGAELVEQTV